jgi:hypothetical protein
MRPPSVATTGSTSETLATPFVFLFRYEPPLTFGNHGRHVLGWSNFPRAHLDPGMIRYQLNGVVDVSGFKDQQSSQELLGSVRNRQEAKIIF